jgi:hypothetical protein
MRANLIEFFLSANLPEHHAELAAVDRNKADRALASLTRVTHRLAINGHDLIRQRREQVAHAANEARFELLRIERGKHAPKSIVGVDAPFRGNMPAQPLQLLFSPDLNGYPSVRARQDRTERHHQYLRQVISRRAAARINQISKASSILSTSSCISWRHPKDESKRQCREAYKTFPQTLVQQRFLISDTCDCPFTTLQLPEKSN